MKSAGISDIGQERAANEDSILLEPEHGLFVVCDGMGGHRGGEVASRTATAGLAELFAHDEEPPAAEELAARIRSVNERIHEAGQEDPQLEGMGTTLVLAQIHEGKLRIAHVGDSRLYLLRDGGGALLTSDHRVIQPLVDRGELDEEGARTHPMRNVLTRSMGVDARVEPELGEMALQPDDRLLLCSDGLSDLLGEEQLYERMGEGDDPRAICQGLVEAANRAGGHDNISAVVVILEPGDFET